MDNVLVIPRVHVLVTEVDDLARSIPGWSNEISGTHNISGKHGEAQVFIDCSAFPLPEYSDDDMKRLCAELGGEPRLAIAIHWSHGAESWRLARSVAVKMLEAWGGVLDDNHGRLLRLEEVRDLVRPVAQGDDDPFST